MSHYHAQLVVVSDVHIADPSDRKLQLLCELLNQFDRSKLEALVLNGDIFEFLLGDRSYFYKRYAQLFDQLHEIARAGVAVYFSEGNHEFHMKKMFANSAIHVEENAFNLRLKTGESFLIAHGDLLTGDPFYALFRWITKSTVVRWMVRVVPSALFDWISQRIARKSRSYDDPARMDHQKLLRKVDAGVQPGLFGFIFGHFHFPYFWQTKDGTKIASVKYWVEEPNCLIYSADKDLRRIVYENGNWREKTMERFPL